MPIKPRKDVKPHSQDNPPKRAGKTGTPVKAGFEFVLAPPARSGHVPLAMAKRPVAKE